MLHRDGAASSRQVESPERDSTDSVEIVIINMKVSVQNASTAAPMYEQ